jgi:hypothetical protein
MAVPGLVHVKFLPPIEPDAAKDRADMSYLVRKRMLECLLKTPADTCRPLLTHEKVMCRVVLILSAVVCTAILWGLYAAAVARFEGMSGKDMALWAGGVSILGTIISFVYCVYIQRWSFQFFQWVGRKFSSSGSRGEAGTAKKDF